MNFDREADILYLAHELWEEMDEPDATPQSCWTQAALQVLARSPRKSDAPVTDMSRYQRYAQAGLATCIDYGQTPVGQGVSLIRQHAACEAANRPVAWQRRLAD